MLCLPTFHNRTLAGPSGRPLSTRLNAVRFLAACLLLGSMLSGQAGGGVIGTSEVLDDNLGSFYVPLKPAASGILGDFLGNDRYVGLGTDRILLQGAGASRSGFVSFVLSYDLAGQFEEYGPGDYETIEKDSATLVLALFDLDLKEIVGLRSTFSEAMELTYLSHVGGRGNTLVIDNDNVALYHDDGAAGETNGVTAGYTLSLRDDFGLSDGDFDKMVEDELFELEITLRSHTERTVAGGAYYSNTVEHVSNSFEFAVVRVPEPGVISLIGLGGVVLVARRRR